MGKLLSDDFVGINMSGQVVTKMQLLDRMRRRRMVLTRLDLDDVHVKLIGQTAIVTSLANVEGTNEGVAMHGTFRYTRVYLRVASGAWQITNYEATRVGHSSAAGEASQRGCSGCSGYTGCEAGVRRRDWTQGLKPLLSWGDLRHPFDFAHGQALKPCP